MGPEFGADLVPLAPAPVPGRPGGTDSLTCSSGQSSDHWKRVSIAALYRSRAIGDLMIRAIDVGGLDVCGNVPLVSMVAHLCPHFAAKYPIGPTRVDENDG